MKKKTGKVQNFILNLTDALQEYLPNDWKKEGLPNPRLIKPYSWGHGGLCIQTTVKGFPSCNLFLSYGISHDILTPVFNKFDLANEFEPIRSDDQFRTDTRNNKLNPDINTVFVEDYNCCDYKNVISTLMENSVDNLMFFFERFSSLYEIRKSIENNEHDFFSLNRATEIIAIDYALSDFDHLFQFRYEKADQQEVDRLEQLAKILQIKI